MHLSTATGLLRTGLAILGCLLCIAYSVQGYTLPKAVVADHTTLNLADIPDLQLEAIKKNFRMYYGHTSHGSQVRVGMERIYAKLGSRYRVAADWDLPSVSNAFCFRDRSDTYDPGDFFPTVTPALSSNPNINVVMYMWCGQPGGDWQELLKYYLAQMADLEQKYPSIFFIYTTGHAQENDCSGNNRANFNAAVRQFCISNKKALLDFGDIDAWYNGEQNTYSSPNWCSNAGQPIPLEHAHYHGDDAGHTTFESCENKGKAFWWLLAKISGWEQTTAARLVSFQAVQKEKAVLLSWTPDSGIQALGYEVERCRQNDVYARVAYIPASAVGSVKGAYSYFDDTIQSGETYYYRLKQIAQGGRVEYSSAIKVTISTHPQFDLWLNYPNPFNRSTEIGFYLPKEEHIKLEIFTMNGERIRTLADERRPPGTHRLVWDGYDNRNQEVSSGIYLYTLKTETFSSSHKMVMLK
jgi:hypothetical protein